MADDQRMGDKGEDDKGRESASSIFAAIMREAAEKAKPEPSQSSGDASEPEAPPADPVSASPDASPAASSDGIAANAKPATVEQQRIRRINRRQQHRRQSGISALGGFFRALFVVGLSTALVATLLTFFTNPQFINPAVVKGLQLGEDGTLGAAAFSTATPVSTPKWHYRIGIIAGHRGRDSGAICSDGFGNVDLREVDINFVVARNVVANLKAENYAVDLLDENDPRLDNYQAAVLVSLHANTCLDFGEHVSGYLIAKSEARPDDGADALLRECVAVNYSALIPLQRSYNLTLDMTGYHVFGKVHPLTPAVILEMGYMLADRDILTTQQDLLAHAISNGIRCYLQAVSGASVAGQASGSWTYAATPVTPGR